MYIESKNFTALSHYLLLGVGIR